MLKRIRKKNDLGGSIFDEKLNENEIYFLAAVDRFAKFPTAYIYIYIYIYIYEKASGPNVLKFLDMNFENHGIPRSLRLDQAKFLVGRQV